MRVMSVALIWRWNSREFTSGGEDAQRITADGKINACRIYGRISMKLRMRCVRALLLALVAAKLLETPHVVAQVYDRSLESLRLRAEAHGENSRDYRVDIYEPADLRRYGRLLEVRCTNCADEYAYQEVVDDHPARIFPLGAHYLVTEWFSGVAKIVRIYRLGDEVKLVLHHGVRGGAEYTLAEDDRTPIIDFKYTNEPWKEKPKVFRETWKWGGTQFVKTNTRCIQNCRP